MIWRWPLVLLSFLLQSARLALGQIWANKARSMLTTIGIVIGVASVTAVIAALTGLKLKVLQDFESFGTNNLYVFADRPRTGPKSQSPWREIRFQPDLFDDMLEHCPSVVRFSRVSGLGDSVRYRDQVLDGVSVVGLEPAWHQIESRQVIMGRPFSPVDEQQARPVCLLTEKVRDKLGLDRDCTGESVTIAGRTFWVVGLVEPRAKRAMIGAGPENELEVFIPFRTLWKMREGWMIVIAASARAEQSEEAKAEILFYLRQARHLKPGEPNTFGVETVDTYIRKFKEVALAITLAAAGIVGISLLVGGVGIMNIMLVSVSERTREIGLRKAVGARPSAILFQFLVEAVTLCLVGGVIGVGVGQALTMALTKINPNLDQSHVPFWAIALSFGFAGTVGVFFGMFPAIKAASLDPIEALRHE